MKSITASCAAFAAVCATASAVNITTSESATDHSELPVQISTTDLLQGLIPVELPGDLGWHPANTDPANQLAAFTDGDQSPGGLKGLMTDFPGEGNPTKRIQYTLPEPSTITEIRVFSGNDGLDGRAFHTYTVEFSSDSGGSWTPPIYVQSHPSGTMNNNMWRMILSQLTPDGPGPLASAVTDIRFDFYAVDNTGQTIRDPFDGVNPFTGVNDGLTPAFVASLIWEIDVIPTPPSALALAIPAMVMMRRRKS